MARTKLKARRSTGGKAKAGGKAEEHSLAYGGNLNIQVVDKISKMIKTVAALPQVYLDKDRLAPNSAAYLRYKEARNGRSELRRTGSLGGCTIQALRSCETGKRGAQDRPEAAGGEPSEKRVRAEQPSSRKALRVASSSGHEGGLALKHQQINQLVETVDLAVQQLNSWLTALQVPVVNGAPLPWYLQWPELALVVPLVLRLSQDERTEAKSLALQLVRLYKTWLSGAVDGALEQWGRATFGLMEELQEYGRELLVAPQQAWEGARPRLEAIEAHRGKLLQVAESLVGLNPNGDTSEKSAKSQAPLGMCCDSADLLVEALRAVRHRHMQKLSTATNDQHLDLATMAVTCDQLVAFLKKGDFEEGVVKRLMATARDSVMYCLHLSGGWCAQG